jgi:hypothetical protein
LCKRLHNIKTCHFFKASIRIYAVAILMSRSEKFVFTNVETDRARCRIGKAVRAKFRDRLHIHDTGQVKRMPSERYSNVCSRRAGAARETNNNGVSRRQFSTRTRKKCGAVNGPATLAALLARAVQVFLQGRQLRSPPRHAPGSQLSREKTRKSVAHRQLRDLG